MADIQRFSANEEYVGEYEKGNYVLYEDHKAIVDELQAKIAKLEDDLLDAQVRECLHG